MRKIFLLALLMCMFLLAAVAEAAQITDVKWGVDKSNVLRLVVDITDSAGYDVKLEGAKLKLTVNAKAAGQVPKVKKIKSDLADELRVVDGGSFTEVHLPLNQPITASDYKAFVLKQDAKTGRPFRVVVDVLAAKNTTPASTAAAAGASAAASKPVVSSKPVVGSRPVKSAASEVYQPTSKPTAEVKAPVVSTQKPSTSKSSGPKVIVVPKSSSESSKATKQATNQATDKVSSKVTSKNDTKVATKQEQEELPLAIKSKKKFRTGDGIKGKIITLDPGHGGSDPGAIGASGLKEKQITLEIGMRLKAKVYMTRTTDKDVYSANASDRAELQARVNVAEKNNSDLFISLHINSSVNKNVGGFSSYYYPKTDYDLKIAQAIQNKFAKNFGVDNLGVRQANFYVVKRFQKKTARLIVEGVKDYFD